MAALAENIGILMRIRADSSDATKDINKFQQELKELDKVAKNAGTPLEQLAGKSGLSAAQFSNLKTGALAAVAGITAVAAVAASTAVTFFNLAQSAGEYGSAIFDAQEKTGLSAATLSTLKLAADTSGSSFDQASTAVFKFSALVGQANQGNEKAIETLSKYGIKSRELNAALDEAVAVLANETDETIQAAIAKDLFKDKTGAVIPVVKALGGSLTDATEKAKKLGTTLSEDDIRAADAFGDAFDVVSMQVKVGASRFALQYAPLITSALQSITEYLATNQQKWGQWGTYVANIITGTSAALRGFGSFADEVLDQLSGKLTTSEQRWTAWSLTAQIALNVVTAGLYSVIAATATMLAQLGEWKTKKDAQTVSIGDMEFDPATNTMQPVRSLTLPNQWRPGSSLGPTVANASGSGRAKRDTSQEDAARKAEELARREAAAEMRGALNNLRRDQQELTGEIDKSIEAYEGLGRVDDLFESVGKEVERLTANITANIAQIERLENANRATNTTQENLLLTQEQLMRQDATKIALDKEVARLKDKVAQKDKEAADEGEKALKRAIELNYERLEQEREKLRLRREMAAPIPAPNGQPDVPAGPYGFDIGGSLQAFIDLVKTDGPTINQTLQEMGNIATSAFGQIAQGIGSMVEAWVLMGTAGPNAMRKMVASVLAGVAAQAAVLAIFELAKGFAALWLNPGEAAMHFKAAALFGVVAVGAALGGRAVAGDAFKTQTASATGGGSSGNNASPSETRYTTQFNGYGQGRDNILVRTLDRVNTTLGLVEETQHQFNRKVLGMSPTDVVVLGANGASREIRGAVESELSSDVGTTDGFMRGLGFAR